MPSGLQDMWLMHVDRYHFDLIVDKDSILAKEGDIEQRKEETQNIIENKKKGSEVPDPGPGYMGWQVDDRMRIWIFKRHILL